jgi:hypothetical protein
VVLLPPTLVKLQHLLRSQGAKDGYITPKDYLSPSQGGGFFYPGFIDFIRCLADDPCWIMALLCDFTATVDHFVCGRAVPVPNYF